MKKKNQNFERYFSEKDILKKEEKRILREKRKKVFCQKFFEMIKKVLIYCILTVAFTVFMLISFMVSSEDKTFKGFKFSIIETGSMQPTLKIGTLILTQKQDSYTINDIINFVVSLKSETGAEDKIQSYTHRIIAMGDRIYWTKGDNNNTDDHEDFGTIPISAVNGKVIFHSYILGVIIVFLKSIPIPVIIAVLAFCAIIFIFISTYIETRMYISSNELDNHLKNRKRIRKYERYINKIIKGKKVKERKIELLNFSGEEKLHDTLIEKNN
jgi:signal peptidase I